MLCCTPLYSTLLYSTVLYRSDAEGYAKSIGHSAEDVIGLPLLSWVRLGSVNSMG